MLGLQQAEIMIIFLFNQHSNTDQADKNKKGWANENCFVFFRTCSNIVNEMSCSDKGKGNWDKGFSLGPKVKTLANFKFITNLAAVFYPLSTEHSFGLRIRDSHYLAH